MDATAVRRRRIEPSAETSFALEALFVHEFDDDAPHVVIPRPEVHLVARFGPSAQDGLDVHVFGARHRAHRKHIRGGQRSVMARLRLGVHDAVIGAPASAVAGRIVALEDLWGRAAARRLREALALAPSTTDAAAVFDQAIAERVTNRAPRALRPRLALDAAARLANDNVGTVAEHLGVSERHLRRVFRDAVGVSPKAFAKLVRFHRALRAARDDAHASWASIASAAGYYDQAHLIAEFRGIAGATPRALLGELRR